MNITKAIAENTEVALQPFVAAARARLTVPMLTLYAKWTAGNNACVSAALRAECQTILGEIILPDGQVRKTDYSPDGRRPLNTTYFMVPTSVSVFALIVKNVVKIGEKRYRFLTDTSPELSGAPSERLIDVLEVVPAVDTVIALERTKMTKRRPASLGAKILIGNIDHDKNIIVVEREMLLFAESLNDAAICRPQAEEAAPIIVPVTSKKDRGTDAKE